MTETPFSYNGVTVTRESNLIEVSNQDGALVTCDLSQALCSLTLDGWQHGNMKPLYDVNGSLNVNYIHTQYI